MQPVIRRLPRPTRRHRDRAVQKMRPETPARWTVGNELTQGDERSTYGTLGRRTRWNAGWPTGREAQGHRAVVVVRERENRSHGEGRQVSRAVHRGGTRNAERRNRTTAHLREQDRHWKAGFAERQTSGLGEGRPKRAGQPVPRGRPILCAPHHGACDPSSREDGCGRTPVGQRLTLRRKPRGTTACRRSGAAQKACRLRLRKTRVLW